MSRTEGFSLPRIPAHHARVISPGAMQPRPAASSSRNHRRTVSEPSYTAFLGTPRQDVPHSIYRDAAMFDDVFDKKGQLLLDRTTPKITAPLNSLHYSSLHDPHCRRLFLNNKKLRSHLMHLGLITEDLKVVATTTEQRQKIRAHELLERKEQLLQRLEDHEESRIERLQRQKGFPSSYHSNLHKEDERRQRAKDIQKMKIEKIMRTEEEKQMMERKRQEKRERELKEAVEEATLMDQARRNAARAQQELAEATAYHRRYGKQGNRIATWRRESDRIHNQMVAMQRKSWHKKKAAARMIEPLLFNASDSTIGSLATPPKLPSIDTEPSTPDHVTAEATNQIPPLPVTDTHDQDDLTKEAASIEVESTKIGENHEGKDTEGTHGVQEMVEKIEELHVEDDSQDEAAMVQGREGDFDHRGSEAESESAAALDDVEMRLLEPEEGGNYLAQIMVDTFNREGTGSEFISKDNFAKVLGSQELGLQLNEAEVAYLAGQCDFYGDDNISFVQVIPQLPEVLRILYNQRAERSMQVYGVYAEEQWCEMQSIGEGHTVEVCYLHKLTGSMQVGGRPQDFRPSLKDDVFEDAIVDFFEIADTDKDGIIDYDDFYSLLVSPLVSSRLYNNQMEDLLGHFVNISTDNGGRMILEDFAPLARILLLIIYQNTYPVEEEWIELESKKVGNFFFNKTTGEVFASTAGYQQFTQREGGQEEVDAPVRRKKRSHRVSWSDSATPTDQPTGRSAPPPLRRRRSRENGENTGTKTISGNETDSTLDSVPEESEDV